MSITIFVLLYCAARLLFIKNFDRFFILQSFTPKEISSRTVLSAHLAIAARFLFFVEGRRWRGALPRKNYISALYTWMKNLWRRLPWAPEVFLSRFPVSVMSLLWQRPSSAISIRRARITSGTQGILATVWSAITPLTTALGGYNAKTAWWNLILFILSKFNKHDRPNFWQSFKQVGT